MRIRFTTLLLMVSPFALLIAAYIQWGTVGIPPVPEAPALTFTPGDAFPAPRRSTSIESRRPFTSYTVWIIRNASTSPSNV